MKRFYQSMEPLAVIQAGVFSVLAWSNWRWSHHPVMAGLDLLLVALSVLSLATNWTLSDVGVSQRRFLRNRRVNWRDIVSVREKPASFLSAYIEIISNDGSVLKAMPTRQARFLDEIEAHVAPGVVARL